MIVVVKIIVNDRRIRSQFQLYAFALGVNFFGGWHGGKDKTEDSQQHKGQKRACK